MTWHSDPKIYAIKRHFYLTDLPGNAQLSNHLTDH